MGKWFYNIDIQSDSEKDIDETSTSNQQWVGMAEAEGGEEISGISPLPSRVICPFS